MRSDLRGSVRLVAFEALAFASLGAPGHERLTAGRATLAARTGLGERTVRRCLKALVAAGFLVPDPKGAPHGARSVCPTRYLFRFEALKAARWVEEGEARSGHGDQTRSGHGDHQGLEAFPGLKNRDALAPPSSPPRGDHAPEVLRRGRKTPPTESARHAANRMIAMGLANDATPIESAHAALAGVGVDAVVLARMVDALGPEQAHDVAAKVKRKRNTRKGGALAMHIMRSDYPEAAARFDASRARGGHRGDRKRQRETFDLGPLDLGEGLRAHAECRALKFGDRRCKCARCEAIA